MKTPKSHGPKNIPWRTISPEDWEKGFSHVARLTGVTRSAAWAAHKRLIQERAKEGRSKPPTGVLKPTDRPGEVARLFRVSITTATRWLAAAGRPRNRTGRRGRPPKDGK